MDYQHYTGPEQHLSERFKSIAVDHGSKSAAALIHPEKRAPLIQKAMRVLTGTLTPTREQINALSDATISDWLEEQAAQFPELFLTKIQDPTEIYRSRTARLNAEQLLELANQKEHARVQAEEAAGRKMRVS
jgi:hypothetical protein